MNTGPLHALDQLSVSRLCLSGLRRISLIHRIRCVSGAGLEKGLYLKMTSSIDDLD